MGQNQKKPLLIGIPTRDGQANIVSILELMVLCVKMGRTHRFLIGEAGNIPKSRNIVMDRVREFIMQDEGTAWVLWMDSDIILHSGVHQEIEKAIEWSETTGKAWVANYKMATFQNGLFKIIGQFKFCVMGYLHEWH